MAKQTQDREDLLRDGTAMPLRGRLIIKGAEIVIGFRADGQLSLYWDQDPVFQFNSAGRLRRVFIDGVRLKADSGKLSRLKQAHRGPKQNAGRLLLQSDWIGEQNQQQILQRLSDLVQTVASALRSHEEYHLQVVGSAPSAFCQRVFDWMDAFGHPIEIADHPSA